MTLMMKLGEVSLRDVPLLAGNVAASPAKPSEIECQVIKLFEQFRDGFSDMCCQWVSPFKMRRR
jgi:hypothetical protein